MRVQNAFTFVICALAALTIGATAYAQATGTPAAPAQATSEAAAVEQRVAAIKQNLAKSAQNIKPYQWQETTVVSYKGEQKSSTTNSCSYDVEGKVVKTPVAAPAPAEEKRGIRGKVAEDKKEEMSATMQSAIALIKTYVPPDPAKIQACKDAGKVTMTATEPGKKARLDFKDYEKPGDDLGIEIDLTTNQILGLSVASYLADAKDAVNLTVVMATLPDGTGYPSTIKIDTPAESMSVAITNSGYQKRAN